MGEPVHSKSTPRTRVGAAIIAALTLIATYVGVVSATAPAGAVEGRALTNAVSNVKMEENSVDSGDVWAGKQIAVDADWAVPADQAPGRVGDHFTLPIPAAVDGWPQEFGIYQKDTTTEVGTCTVAPRSITCTLTNEEFLKNNQNVHGHVQFYVVLNKSDEPQDISWEGQGSASYHVSQPVPDNGPVVYVPNQWVGKNSVTEKNGQIAWFFEFDDELPKKMGVTPDQMPTQLHFEDTMSNQVLVPNALDDWKGGTTTVRFSEMDKTEKVWRLVEGKGTVKVNPEGNGYTIDTTGLEFGKNKAYQLHYLAEPAPGVNPTDPAVKFTNIAKVNGTIVVEAEHEYQLGTASADGEAKPATGSVKWTKVDANNGDVLAGSEWKIVSEDGKTTVAVVDNDARDTDKTDGKFAVADLPLGNYQLIETKAPHGHVLDAAAVPFTLADGGAAGESQLSVDLGEIDNERTEGSVSWHKVDPQGKALAGTTWRLDGPNGDYLFVKDNGRFDEDPAEGSFKVSGLEWGKYTLLEEKAAPGFALSTKTHDLEITPDALEATVAEKLVNHPLAGTLNWGKTDTEGKALAGAEWSLTGPDGKAVTVVDNADNDADKTDGKFSVTGLAWGEYVLKETKAPTGYVVSTEEHTATIGADTLTASFGDVENKAEETTPPATETPTEEPTPSETPSETPTEEPTPSETPTATPTEEPSEEPTPSETPSETPTEEPSAPVETSSTPVVEPTPSESNPPLVNTGANVTGIGMGATVLVLLGVAGLIAANRRRNQH